VCLKYILIMLPNTKENDFVLIFKHCNLHTIADCYKQHNVKNSINPSSLYFLVFIYLAPNCYLIYRTMNERYKVCCGFLAIILWTFAVQ
jgi:hypothetical protein